MDPSYFSELTVRTCLPLARRFASIFLPPGVFMRVRKPCVFARLRRFGWNVLLGIRAPGRHGPRSTAGWPRQRPVAKTSVYQHPEGGSTESKSGQGAIEAQGRVLCAPLSC